MGSEKEKQASYICIYDLVVELHGRNRECESFIHFRREFESDFLGKTTRFKEDEE